MSIGITDKQRRCLNVIINSVALHGAAPSIRSLADALGCNPSNACRLVNCLIERGMLSRMPDGSLALGSGGVMVNVPRDVAAKLARFCQDSDERISEVVADAILLHLDDIERGEIVTHDEARPS